MQTKLGSLSPRPFRHLASLAMVVGLAALFPPAGCGGTTGSHFGLGGGGGGSGGSGGGDSSDGGGGGTVGNLGGGGGGGGGGSDAGMPPCPPGLQCNPPCNGTTTSISGVVYDPAGKNPLYDIAVYVPERPLKPLPRGVPTGSDACNCAALFESGGYVGTTTGVDGSFVLDNAPVGKVPVVIQVGKWRRQITMNVTACQNNVAPKLTLPGTLTDPNDSMPDIAVSTGGADTLECLMTRIGLPASEYVAGAAMNGHVHLFAGGGPKAMGGMGGGVPAGYPETPAAPGAPTSYQNLWDSLDHLMPYDILLLSCEGGETYNANPAVLEQYLNVGGRAFASHFHYAWFSGPTGSGQSYSAPADWGNNLATWVPDGGNGMNDNGTIVQTLNGTGQTFVKGQALYQWLGQVKALGPGNTLPIVQPRYNASVGPANKPSQPWITSTAMQGSTMYFSFDTPVNAPPAPDGGAPQYCGRAVFSDLHVGGATQDNQSGPPPGGCNTGDLSPQEKALEFMLFDLSSCVIPDTQPPPGQPPVQ